MKCLHPITLKCNNENYNDGTFEVPCGKCVACVQNKARDLAFRLDFENISSGSSFFVTLTYSDDFCPVSDVDYSTGEYIPGVAYEVDKNVTKKFFGSMRNYFWRQSCIKFPKELRHLPNRKQINLEIDKQRKQYYGSLPLNRFKYYLVSEYGPVGNRPHYHFIIYYDSKLDIVTVEDHLKKFWPYGFVTVSHVTNSRINYLAQYMKKECPPQTTCQIPNITRCSKGIGSSLLDSDLIRRKCDNDFLLIHWRNHNINLPSYYRKKLVNQGKRRKKGRLTLQILGNKQLLTKTNVAVRSYSDFLTLYSLPDTVDSYHKWYRYQSDQDSYLISTSHGLNKRKF
ncbi:replication initiator protein [Capybara microvirus Cap1_SP_92]|nr:replication initiator protein [Capybara microvirus Cap1_SP_92]